MQTIKNYLVLWHAMFLLAYDAGAQATPDRMLISGGPGSILQMNSLTGEMAAFHAPPAGKSSWGQYDFAVDPLKNRVIVGRYADGAFFVTVLDQFGVLLSDIPTPLYQSGFHKKWEFNTASRAVVVPSAEEEVLLNMDPQTGAASMLYAAPAGSETWGIYDYAVDAMTGAVFVGRWSDSSYFVTLVASSGAIIDQATTAIPYSFGNGGFCFDSVRRRILLTMNTSGHIGAISLLYNSQTATEEIEKVAGEAFVTPVYAPPTGIGSSGQYDFEVDPRRGEVLVGRWQDDASYISILDTNGALVREFATPEPFSFGAAGDFEYDCGPMAAQFKQTLGPWALRGYLLRDASFSSPAICAPVRTHKAWGCDLASIATIFRFYGFSEVTPLSYQEFLNRKWCDRPGCISVNDGQCLDSCEMYPCAPWADRYAFIMKHNDPSNAAVYRYSLTLGTGRSLLHIGEAGGGQANLSLLLAELRAGRPVKIRAPSCSNDRWNQRGHWIVAYGLRDPARKDANIELGDILIADVGHKGIISIQDYNDRQLNCLGADPHWLTDAEKRITRYTAQAVPPSQYGGTVQSPVEILITDPSGLRLGLDPAIGQFDEIAGGAYWVDDPFYALDESGEDSPKWDPLDPYKHFTINNAQEGIYTIEIIGTGSGAYGVTLYAAGPLGVFPKGLDGTTTPGQRDVFAVTVYGSASQLETTPR